MSKVNKWVPTTDLMMLRRMGKLQEEMHELGEVAARCIIQGIDEIDPGTGNANRDRLWREIADVYAQLDETVARLGLSATVIEARRAEKRGYMQQWEAMFENGGDVPQPEAWLYFDTESPHPMCTTDQRTRDYLESVGIKTYPMGRLKS